MVKKKSRQINLFEPTIFYEHGDALDLLGKNSHIKFDLVITSPPYNVGKEKKSIYGKLN